MGAPEAFVARYTRLPGVRLIAGQTSPVLLCAGNSLTGYGRFCRFTGDTEGIGRSAVFDWRRLAPNSSSAARDDDVPRRGRLRSLEAHVREACLRESRNNVVRRSRCEDVRRHSQAIDPILRKEADHHTAA